MGCSARRGVVQITCDVASPDRSSRPRPDCGVAVSSYRRAHVRDGGPRVARRVVASTCASVRSLSLDRATPDDHLGSSPHGGTEDATCRDVGASRHPCPCVGRRVYSVRRCSEAPPRWFHHPRRSSRSLSTTYRRTSCEWPVRTRRDRGPRVGRWVVAPAIEIRVGRAAVGVGATPHDHLASRPYG
jgi:hypothetical protein